MRTRLNSILRRAARATIVTASAATLLVTSSAAAMTWLDKDITTSSYSDCHGFAAGASAGRLAVRYHTAGTCLVNSTTSAWDYRLSDDYFAVFGGSSYPVHWAQSWLSWHSSGWSYRVYPNVGCTGSYISVPYNVNTMTTSITDNSVSTPDYQATCQAA